MTQKTKAEFLADNAQALADNQRISAETLRDEFGHLSDSVPFLDALASVATSGLLADLDTSVTGSDLDGIQVKLDDIEPNATADQTGAEIVTLLDGELGGTTWQGGGGGGGGGLSNVVDDLTPQLGGNLDLNSFSVGPATVSHLTKLSQLVATSTEINYTANVTSNIQTQLNGKATSAQGALADTALQPADIATGPITPRDDDLDLSGGSDGHVLTVQSNGSAEFEALPGFALLTGLASTANGDGASLIGVEDSGGLITATTVEGALAEVKTLADTALQPATGMMVVNHGATAGTARPAGAAAVYWIGSVEPTNATAGDQWYDTSA